MPFRHLLHQVDAAARAVELIAQQLVGGTGGGAKAAMHVHLRRDRAWPRCPRASTRIRERCRSACQSAAKGCSGADLALPRGAANEVMGLSSAQMPLGERQLRTPRRTKARRAAGSGASGGDRAAEHGWPLTVGAAKERGVASCCRRAHQRRGSAVLSQLAAVPLDELVAGEAEQGRGRRQRQPPSAAS